MITVLASSLYATRSGRRSDGARFDGNYLVLFIEVC